MLTSRFSTKLRRMPRHGCSVSQTEVEKTNIAVDWMGYHVGQTPEARFSKCGTSIRNRRGFKNERRELI
jgi:hypothetical protein